MTTITTTTTTTPTTNTTASTTVVVDLPFVEYLKLEYAEAQQYVRHYSTVRVVVSTFLFGVAFHILKDKRIDDEFFWVRLVFWIWVVSLVFLYAFTIVEQREKNYASTIREMIKGKTIKLVNGTAVHPTATTDVLPSRRGDWKFVWKYWLGFKDVPFLVAIGGTAIFIPMIAVWLSRQARVPSWQNLLNPFHL